MRLQILYTNERKNAMLDWWDEALAEMNKFIPKLKQWASIIMRQSNLNHHIQL